MRRLVLLLCAMFVACGSSGGELALPEPSGPPTIDPQLVRQHGEQFDVDVPDRPAGSQHELAAATYILGHLQLAGYRSTITQVPVADQVHSSNVVALPADVDEPEVLVLIPYDSGDGKTQSGDHLGMFLELARALNVAAPGHRSGFVALGAELSRRGETTGSDALAEYVEDQGWEVQLIHLRIVGWRGQTAVYTGSCQAGGAPATGLVDSIDDCGEGDVYMHQVFDERVLGQTRVEGDPTVIGPELLRFLQTTAD